MNNQIYKIGEALGMTFLQIPYALIVDKKYSKMTSEAKIAYSLILRRLQLSNMKGWINEENELYIIYTREQMACELNVSYKKSTAVFSELSEHNLITEKRRGRGLANYIFVMKPELSDSDAIEVTEELRTVEMTHQEFSEDEIFLENSADISDIHVKGGKNEISGCEDFSFQDVSNLPMSTEKRTGLDVSFLPTSKKEFSYKEISDIDLSENECSQSFKIRFKNNATGLEKILRNCEFDIFPDDEADVFRFAIERLYYSKSFTLGNAEFPQDAVREYLEKLTTSTLQVSRDKIRSNKGEIKNAMGYVMAVIFNSICEETADYMLDSFLIFT